MDYKPPVPRPRSTRQRIKRYRRRWGRAARRRTLELSRVQGVTHAGNGVPEAAPMERWVRSCGEARNAVHA